MQRRSLLKGIVAVLAAPFVGRVAKAEPPPQKIFRVKNGTVVIHRGGVVDTLEISGGQVHILTEPSRGIDNLDYVRFDPSKIVISRGFN